MEFCSCLREGYEIDKLSAVDLFSYADTERQGFISEKQFYRLVGLVAAKVRSVREEGRIFIDKNGGANFVSSSHGSDGACLGGDYEDDESTTR